MSLEAYVDELAIRLNAGWIPAPGLMENVMGKLHTLRRAIERDPEKWGNSTRSCGAWFNRRSGQWEPLRYYREQYGNFVAHVLRCVQYERMGKNDSTW